jgi:hypothetical protein
MGDRRVCLRMHSQWACCFCSFQAAVVAHAAPHHVHEPPAAPPLLRAWDCCRQMDEPVAVRLAKAMSLAVHEQVWQYKKGAEQECELCSRACERVAVPSGAVVCGIWVWCAWRCGLEPAMHAACFFSCCFACFTIHPWVPLEPATASASITLPYPRLPPYATPALPPCRCPPGGGPL